MVFDISPFLLSLRISLTAISIVFILGLLAARLCMEMKGHLKWILDVLFTLPLVLPPTVIGFILLMLYNKNGPIGKLFDRINVSFIFTERGAVLAAVVVAFPLMYRAAKGAFEQVDEELIWAARALGLSEIKVFTKVLIPEAWPGIISGLILAFTRALGEFGATLMIAGNIPKVTQTIPLAIYFAVANGKMALAMVWTVVISLISCVMLWAMNHYNRN